MFNNSDVLNSFENNMYANQPRDIAARISSVEINLAQCGVMSN